MTRHDPADADRDPQQDDGLVDEVGRTLAAIAPWAVSVLAHVVLVLLAVFLVWSTVLHEDKEPWDGQVTFSEAPVTPIHDPVLEDAEAEPEPSTRPMPSPIQPQTPELPETLGPMAGPSFPDLRHRDPSIPDDGSINRQPTIGNPVLGDTGRQTVFVIDASGSLIDTFPRVINELKKLLVQLARAEEQRQADPTRQHEPPYAYAVVFFRDGEVLVQDRRGLRQAGTDTVQRSVAWLGGVTPGGTTSPLPAIELALSYDPDTVVLLSDNITGHGIHELDTDRLVDRVMDARGGRDIAINTIQFLYPDPQEAYGREGTLRRLARETDGEYRFVGEQELHLR